MPDDALRRSQLEVVALPGPQTTLSLAGDLDPATAPELDARLQDLIADAAVSSVVIDLAEIAFMDSSGLRVLVAASAALGERSGSLVLRNPSTNIRRVLEVTGLASLVEAG